MTDNITLPRSLVEQAMKALEDRESTPAEYDTYHALNAALQQPQVEQPVAWIFNSVEVPNVKFLEWQNNPLGYRGEWIKTPLYTNPQPLRQPQNHCKQNLDRVPAGWKLVPVEPTDDMLYDIQEFSHILPPRGKRIWAHMLAAAPQPPTTEQSSAVQPQVEQEPVAWMWEFKYDSGAAFSTKKPNIAISDGVEYIPLYTHPQPKREPLTDEQIMQAVRHLYQSDYAAGMGFLGDLDVARAIERAHGIGGEA